MNAPVALLSPAVREVDLRDWDELRRIDDFVAGHRDAQIFHRPQWVRAVESACSHRPVFLVAEGAGGAVLGILSLSHVRSRLFGSALVSAGFGVGGGILSSDPLATAALADAAWAQTQKLGCASLELRGGTVPVGFARCEGLYAGFERELPPDEEAILKAIPRKQRAEVRKAQDLGMTVDIGRGELQRSAHYRVYSESVRNLGTPVFPRSLFDAMLEAFGPDADILTISKGGTAVASVLSFYFKGAVLPYWGGGTRAARNLRANELLYFELMRHAAARGCTRFDFGRSKVGTGAYAYKKNWGFEPQPLVYARRTADGAAPREINPLDPKYRLKIALWRKLPLWAANLLGPPIARGLG